jgi:hypothetical protein
MIVQRILDSKYESLLLFKGFVRVLMRGIERFLYVGLSLRVSPRRTKADTRCLRPRTHDERLGIQGQMWRRAHKTGNRNEIFDLVWLF